MVSVSEIVLQERLNVLELGTSFQCLNLFTNKLLHNQRDGQMDLKD